MCMKIEETGLRDVNLRNDEAEFHEENLPIDAKAPKDEMRIIDGMVFKSHHVSYTVIYLNTLLKLNLLFSILTHILLW